MIFRNYCLKTHHVNNIFEMIIFTKGSEKTTIDSNELKEIIFSALNKIGQRKKVLIVPPDYTRFHSRAGEITRYAYEYLGNKLTDILPALGTHAPMNEKELTDMFGNIPKNLFRIHNWRSDLVTLGEVPSSFLEEVSEGKVKYSWPAQVNKLMIEGDYDLILSIGQVVPHEVVGMANYNKNIFVGTGGREGINKSHFLGAVYGMERMMGQIDTPVRKVLNYAGDHFAKKLPVIYIQTVICRDENGCLQLCGIFIGDDAECFNLAAELSQKVNFQLLDKPIKKAVCFLDPHEYKSTWLGNKSIYRTRMALADNGELIVLAPGLKEFGEDKEIDRLIRKYGYIGTPGVLSYVNKDEELRNNLSAAAHLIHGSSEGRFTVTYCPGFLSENEIRKANFNFASLEKMLKKYKPEKLKEGYNSVEGEEIFYISNPALGLWASKNRMQNSEE
jgi:nickel-dependent lactate racemase